MNTEFNWINYVLNYEDLLNENINNYKKAYNHWINHGIKEGRTFEKKNNFDWKQYIENYEDLRIAGIDEEFIAAKHWINHGIKEGRTFERKNNFNCKQNIENNEDLINNGLRKGKTYYKTELNKFLNDYNEKYDNYITNEKIQFRFECYININYIRNIILPEIKYNNKYEAVLIEYRKFPHLEFLIRNTINKLGSDWSHTIVCGNLNYEYMRNMCKNISPNIKVIKTNFDNLNQSTYSEFLASIEFWEMFSGEKILLYQEDSCIFKSNIDDFIHWDYIGAPWPKSQNDNPNCVGNGGLSLRTKSCMINVIKKISIKDTVMNSSTLKYIKSYDMTVCPEDVYFSLNMIKFNIGKVADWNSAFNFSTETQFNPNSFGGHNFWLCDKKWKDRIKSEIIEHMSKLNYSVKIIDDYAIVINKQINLEFFEINQIKINIFKKILEKNNNLNSLLIKEDDRKIFFIKKNLLINIKTFDDILKFYDKILVINNNDFIKEYDINFMAIYFPQFHKIPENDKFWGENFTEWTLLKDHDDVIYGKNNRQIEIMKPHKDIGYYDLNFETFIKQCNISDQYGIDSFMVYHYWFTNSHKVMYKPLEFFKQKNKKFVLCWANEPWTNRWDGGNSEVLLSQEYDNFHNMIEYLYNFFKLDNYQRDKNGNIIYFIYNYEHIGKENLENLKNIWTKYLKERNETIIFIYSSSFVTNMNTFNNTNLYLFEPLENNINRFRINKNVDSIDFDYYYVNYNNIINYYKLLNISTLTNKIQGVSLNWNNVVRRKNKKFLYVDNFKNSKLIDLLEYQVSNIILKNNYFKDNTFPNILMFNAWNEWNEQAILEPNNLSGYDNLKHINFFKDHIRKNIFIPKKNLLFIDIFIDKINNGGANYTTSCLKILSNKYNIYYHPNTNKYSQNFNDIIKQFGCKILIANNISTLDNFKEFNFEKIIIGRISNDYYYDRLIKLYPDKKNI